MRKGGLWKEAWAINKGGAASWGCCHSRFPEGLPTFYSSSPFWCCWKQNSLQMPYLQFRVFWCTPKGTLIPFWACLTARVFKTCPCGRAWQGPGWVVVWAQKGIHVASHDEWEWTGLLWCNNAFLIVLPQGSLHICHLLLWSKATALFPLCREPPFFKNNNNTFVVCWIVPN